MKVKKLKGVHGHGTNDADYEVYYKVFKEDGTFTKRVCPYYAKWKHMIGRVFCEKIKSKHKSYTKCKIQKEWLTFSNFKRWMEKQDWEGKQLDKDLLSDGTSIYSESTCCFLNQIVNTFIADGYTKNSRGMIGAHPIKGYIKWRSKISINSNGVRSSEHLGYFDTELEAHLAWKARKHELACQLAESEYVTDERVAEALRNRYK